MTAIINNNQNFRNINNQSSKNKKQGGVFFDGCFRVEPKIERSNAQANSQKKSILSNKSNSEKLIPNTESIADSYFGNSAEYWDRKRNIELGIDYDRKVKIEALLFGKANDERMFTSYEYYSAAFDVYNFNEKYSDIKDLANQDLNVIGDLFSKYEQKASEAKKEYETKMKNANLDENEMIGLRDELHSIGLGLSDEEFKKKMYNLKKYDEISGEYINKRKKALDEYFEESCSNKVKYAKNLFDFFDNESNQVLINEFLNDVVFVMELKKNNENKYEEMVEEMVYGKKSLDEIRESLNEKNTNIFTENNDLGYDQLNSLYKNLLRNILSAQIMQNTSKYY